ncbi:translation initiation factor IF-2-like isoform X1 [Falco rusticolus]|uniref:translation initiation factor IF-2-like isoform X1 n=1 Tax=Falco rusticolus TaxID=120794 RepID=UPI0018865B3B|nr:translation initiation factor IF-2-like isoform X1 [Falco rusticolus]
MPTFLEQTYTITIDVHCPHFTLFLHIRPRRRQGSARSAGSTSKPLRRGRGRGGGSCPPAAWAGGGRGTFSRPLRQAPGPLAASRGRGQRGGRRGSRRPSPASAAGAEHLPRSRVPTSGAPGAAAAAASRPPAAAREGPAGAAPGRAERRRSRSLVLLSLCRGPRRLGLAGVVPARPRPRRAGAGGDRGARPGWGQELGRPGRGEEGIRGQAGSSCLLLRAQRACPCGEGGPAPQPAAAGCQRAQQGPRVTRGVRVSPTAWGGPRCTRERRDVSGRPRLARKSCETPGGYRRWWGQPSDRRSAGGREKRGVKKRLNCHVFTAVPKTRAVLSILFFCPAPSSLLPLSLILLLPFYCLCYCSTPSPSPLFFILSVLQPRAGFPFTSLSLSVSISFKVFSPPTPACLPPVSLVCSLSFFSSLHLYVLLRVQGDIWRQGAPQEGLCPNR